MWFGIKLAYAGGNGPLPGICVALFAGSFSNTPFSIESYLLSIDSTLIASYWLQGQALTRIPLPTATSIWMDLRVRVSMFWC